MENPPDPTEEDESSQFELFFVFLLGALEDSDFVYEEDMDNNEYQTLTSLSFRVARPDEDEWPPAGTPTLACPVCYEEVPWCHAACIDRCRHALCVSCLVQLLQSSLSRFRDPTCPLCRAVIEDLVFENESSIRMVQTSNDDNDDNDNDNDNDNN
jgi:hypothetical protein